VVMALVIHYVGNVPTTTLAGIFSGAVTNTPALGGAQQATTDVFGFDAPKIAMGFDVTYPMGVLGVILSFVILRYALRIDIDKEEVGALRGLGSTEQLTIHHITVEVDNDMLDGKTVGEIRQFAKRELVVAGVVFANGGEQCHIVSGKTVIHKGDRLFVAVAPKDEEVVNALFGRVADHDWTMLDASMKTRRLYLSNQHLNGKAIRELAIRSRFNANIVQVTRNGVNHVASPQFMLQIGDVLTVVGSENALVHTESEITRRSHKVSYGDLIPIFLGIALGCVLAHIPFFVPGLPQPVKFGLAGGPLIVAILMGFLDTKYHKLNTATFSSGSMLREIGIAMFLACVGLQAGKDFVSTVVTTEGLQWAGYGLLITMVPIIVGGIIGRCVMHLNFFTLMGVLSGGNTNPPALAYANELTTTDVPSVGYTIVYPLAMVLRIIIIQVLIMAIV